jgi:hypothetical protein
MDAINIPRFIVNQGMFIDFSVPSTPECCLINPWEMAMKEVWPVLNLIGCVACGKYTLRIASLSVMSLTAEEKLNMTLDEIHKDGTRQTPTEGIPSPSPRPGRLAPSLANGRLYVGNLSYDTSWQ